MKRLILGAGSPSPLLGDPGHRTLLPPAECRPQLADIQAQGTEIPMDDWHLMLNAVKERLRQLVDTPGGPQPAAVLAPDVARRVQSDLLECVYALDLLQAALPQVPDRG